MRRIDELLQSMDTNAKDKRVLLALKEYGTQLHDTILV